MFGRSNTLVGRCSLKSNINAAKYDNIPTRKKSKKPFRQTNVPLGCKTIRMTDSPPPSWISDNLEDQRHHHLTSAHLLPRLPLQWLVSYYTTLTRQDRCTRSPARNDWKHNVSLGCIKWLCGFWDRR